MSLSNLGLPQGVTWVKDQNGRWQRSDAYNPDTGKLLFPERNGGQTISPEFSRTPAPQQSQFVIGGSTSGGGQATSFRGDNSDIAQFIRGLDWSAGQPTANATRQLFNQAQNQGWSDAQIGKAMGFTPQQVAEHWQKYGVNSGPSGQPGLNPFQPQMFDAVTNQVTQNLNRNILPGIRSASVATGGYGGSRQGVVEANALNDANQGLSNTLGNIQYTDWNNLQNRQVTNKGMDQSFYTAQRGQDLQQTALGANLFQQGIQGMLGQGQGIYNLGLTQQQAPWQTLTGFTGVSSPYTGYGSTSQSASGNPLGGAMGGALMGGQIYNAWRGDAGQPAVSSGGGLGLQGPSSGFWATR